jgi:hypothetical protein
MIIATLWMAATMLLIYLVTYDFAIAIIGAIIIEGLPLYLYFSDQMI